MAQSGETFDLTTAADICHDNNNDTNFITLLAMLKKTPVLVPMIETEYGAMPYILESEDGTEYYPAFSDEKQIPREYRESLEWAVVPFESTAEYVMESVSVSNILLNAFTKSVVIPEASVRVVMKEDSSRHAVDAGSLKLLSAEGEAEADELKRAAYAFFYDRKDVKKAYFAKLLNGGEMSYIFVVEAEGDSQSMFNALFEAIGMADISMPIDYTVYPSLASQLEEIGCEPFFVS